MFKDRKPEESVNIFKGILNNLELSFNEEVQEICPGIWCCWLENSQLGWKAQGKGTSLEYCLASGYGEILERLENLFCSPLIRDDFLEKNRSAFKYFPDERYFLLKDVSFPELIEDYIRCYEKDHPLEKVSEEEISSYLNLHGLDNEICLPFYSYANKKVVYLPIDRIRSFQGSNGLAAGNTYKEALVEGLSEILERWAEEYMFQSGLTPPIIPKDFIKENYPDEFQRLLNLEEKCGLEITVFDCSLGQGVPVLITLFADKNNKLYKRSVGSHPLFGVALDRCLTESVQCNPIWDLFCRQSLMTSFNLESQLTWNTASQYSQRINRHIGSIPNSFFYKTPSWEFKPWNLENFSNEAAVIYLLDICKKFGSDVFIRANGFLGVPAVTIYVPSLSMLTMPRFNKTLYFKNLFDEYQNIWLKGEVLSPEVRKQVIALFESRQELDVAIPFNIPREVFLSSLYVEDNQKEKAIQILKGMLEERWKCAASVLEFSYESKENLKNLLSYFYSNNIIDNSIDIWTSNTPSTDLFKKDINIDSYSSIKDDCDLLVDTNDSEFRHSFLDKIRNKSIKISPQGDFQKLIEKWSK